MATTDSNFLDFSAFLINYFLYTVTQINHILNSKFISSSSSCPSDKKHPSLKRARSIQLYPTHYNTYAIIDINKPH